MHTFMELREAEGLALIRVVMSQRCRAQYSAAINVSYLKTEDISAQLKFVNGLRQKTF